MKKSSPQVRLPRSFRTDAKLPANMSKTTLAIGISTAMLLPTASFAAEPAAKEQDAQQLQAVKVEATAIDPNPNAQPGVPYKAQFSADRRRTKPLAETPATIQVLTAEAIKDSGYTDLREILDSQPGITLGTGENGNAFGDRYIIRGQEARSDVFVDGLRDPGMTIRESFAVEQLEITKGPNSTFAGRGSAGGAINAVTKQATTDYNFAKLSTGFGTDNHTRITVDANQALTDTVAVRANVLYGYEEVPDRESLERERSGLALSALFKPVDKLDITLDYYGLRAEDDPDLGSWFEGTIPNQQPRKDPPVYAQDPDFLKSEVDTLTARINYAFTDNLRLSNLTRYGETFNGYVATSAGVASTNANDPSGVYETVTLGTHQGWQEVDYFANQTNLFFDTDIAGMHHEFVATLEYTNNKVLNGVYSVVNSGSNCVTGGGTGQPGYCLTDASGNWVGGINTLMNRTINKSDRDQDWSIDTTSLSLMDSVDLTDRLTVFGGVRYDYFDFELVANWNHDGDTGGGATPQVLGDFRDSDGFWNGSIGLTYQITDEGMVYLGYGTAKDINGGESDVGTNSGYGGLAINFACVDQTNPNPALRGCDPNGDIEAKPETSENYEIGTKWNLFDERLLLTAALFQIDKKDVMEGVGYTATGSFNTGENRVRGIEIGVTGEITEKLVVQAGAAFMDAEILKGYRTQGNPPEPIDIEGKTLSNFADETAFAQLKYEVVEELWIGAAAKYESEKYPGQPDTAPGLTNGQYSRTIPSYTVYDLFATYRFTKQLDMRLNVGNVTDKDYYLAGYQSGRMLYIGDARNYRVTLNYEF